MTLKTRRPRSHPARFTWNLGLAAVIVVLIALAGPGRGDAAITRAIPGGYQASVDLAEGTSFAASPRGAGLFHFAGTGATSYGSSDAAISKEHVDVTFGALASFHLRFHPDGPPKEEPRANSLCRGGRALSWTGVFSGNVGIRAKYGFPSVRTRAFRRHGSLYFEPRLLCRYPDPDPSYQPKPGNQVQLGASACDGRYFSAHTERSDGAVASTVGDEFVHPRYVSYSASASIELPGVTVSEAVSAHAGPSTFVFDEALTTATVNPPPPFHGTATLSRADDGSTAWAGSLSATILGRNVSLAGPGFQSNLESFQLPPGSGFLALFASPC